ncbi:heavy-metal-associated domain-containing protein [Mycolicibacterium tusciae]|uniref:heavy-metal-associated domain-containing protein n=1 Tax=Mycolicibacterium tusciae TaxID=75922 RepID=UPI003B3A55F9
MTCGHCEMSVREEVRSLGGVKHVEVSAATGELVVTSEEPIADAAIMAAVERVRIYRRADDMSTVQVVSTVAARHDATLSRNQPRC